MNRKEVIVEKFYLMGISVLSIYICLSPSLIIDTSGIIGVALELLILLCFFIKLIYQKYTIKEILVVLFLGGLALYTTYVTQNRKIFCSFLALIAMKDVKVQKIIKVIFYSSLAIILVEAIYYIICLNLDKGKITKFYINSKGQTRHTLFIGHPNVAAQSILWVTAMYVYLNFNKKKTGFLLGIIILSMLVTDYFTISRTSSICFILLAVLVFLVKQKKIKIDNILVIVSKYAFIICMALSFLAIYFYYNNPENEFINKLDELLSWRILCSTIGYNEYGMTILGQKVLYNIIVSFRGSTFQTLMLDNMYVKILCNYGIVYLILFIYFILKTANKCKTEELIFFILLAVVALSENMVFYPTRALMFFFIVEKLYTNQYKSVNNMEKFDSKEVK